MTISWQEIRLRNRIPTVQWDLLREFSPEYVLFSEISARLMYRWSNPDLTDVEIHALKLCALRDLFRLENVDWDNRPDCVPLA